MISPHRISQEHCIGTSLRKSSNFERNRFLRSRTLRWLAFASQRQGRGGSSVVGRGNCPAELTNQLAQPSSHRPATTSAACPEQPRPLAASASPALLPWAGSAAPWQAAGPPATDQPLAQPSRRTNLPSPARTSSLTVASAACMPTPPTGRQPRPSPGSRPTSRSTSPADEQAQLADSRQRSPARGPPALAQPGPAASPGPARPCSAVPRRQSTNEAATQQ